MTWNRISRTVGILCLAAALVFNLLLYRHEPEALVDPNDNSFQYALVERTNAIWDYADRTCPKNPSFVFCHTALLLDHWVPNWAQGYNLPFYYSHIPQILIVGSYRFLDAVHLMPDTVTLFRYYHSVIYLLLSLFPLSVFLALLVLKENALTAGVGSLLASHISTDGLYGIDPPSFLWRGWGLSSQLFAILFAPLAVALAIRWIRSENMERHRLFVPLTAYIGASIVIAATTAGHLGIGLMLFLSLPVIAFIPAILDMIHMNPVRTILESIGTGITKTALLAAVPFILLSYWIIPTVLSGAYHNISFWDPIWKFSSFGAKEVMVNLFAGALFDWNRLPVYTLAVLVGWSSILLIHPKRPLLLPLPFLFVFFLLLYFGTTTWGSVLYLIPGMNEFHQHRFIVGIHLIGLFLAPIGITMSAVWFSDRIMAIIKPAKTLKLALPILITTLITAGVIWAVYPQTIAYATYNDTLITNANVRFATQKSDADLLIRTLRELPPGRIFAGRGGSWGKSFEVAETPYFMHISTYGLPTVLWLPETWSNNSDTEQYFSEDQPDHYALYAIRYVVAPPQQPAQKFWKKHTETDSWILYEVETPEPPSYITAGTSPGVVHAPKGTFGNVVRLWIQSAYPGKRLFPQLILENGPKNKSSNAMPTLRMTDEATYRTPDNTSHSLFAQPPVYMTPWEWPSAFPWANPGADAKKDTPLPMAIETQSNDSDMVFRSRVMISQPCPTCVVVLKQTYHPNWQATINGKPVTPINVFPSFVAVRLEEPGSYDVVFTYTPSRLKMLLYWGAITMVGVVIGWIVLRKKPKGQG